MFSFEYLSIVIGVGCICEHVNKLLNTEPGAQKTLNAHSGAQRLNIKRRRLNIVSVGCERI